MSLIGGGNTAADQAVANSMAAGVAYAVAAGNDNADACNYSPARVSGALTVGASTSWDARSAFSNWGTCLDVFAPGSYIRSAWHTSSTETNILDGTSMASPHVAGVAALYLQNNTAATPAAVASTIVSWAFTNKLSGIGTGSPNRLLNSLLVTPLGVQVICQRNYYYWPHWYDCTAVADGGSGTGYSMTWSNANALERSDAGGYSEALASCDFDGSFYYWTDVYVTVSDSDGRTLTVSHALPCSDDW
jgi:subtilisin family serine protease